MVKIYIFIFSLSLVASIQSESISRKELSILRENCLKTYKEKKYSEAIPLLEKYLSFREEIKFKTLLAKSILFRTDLVAPKEEDEIFIRDEKIHTAIENYKKSARVFSEVIPYLEKVTPNDKSIGELYFLWALSEQFSNEREKAIPLYKKSALLKKDLAALAFYNIGSIYEFLGQKKDSEIYFSKYNQASVDKKEEIREESR